jgi:hypothetical protein
MMSQARRTARRGDEASKFSVVGGRSAAADPMASRVRDTAGRLADELDGAGSPLAAMAVARELSAATGEALQEAVDRARAAGHSWREIGDVLGTTRQAASSGSGVRSTRAPASR